MLSGNPVTHNTKTKLCASKSDSFPVQITNTTELQSTIPQELEAHPHSSNITPRAEFNTPSGSDTPPDHEGWKRWKVQDATWKSLSRLYLLCLLLLPYTLKEAVAEAHLMSFVSVSDQAWALLLHTLVQSERISSKQSPNTSNSNSRFPPLITTTTKHQH